MPGCNGAVPDDRAALRENVRVKCALKANKRRRTEEPVSSLDVDSL